MRCDVCKAMVRPVPRPTSEFHLNCPRCEATIVSVTRDCKCQKCGSEWTIGWPVRNPHIKTL